MPAVFLPTVGSFYRVTEEWKPMLHWVDRNLVLFRNLKLTGTKKISTGIHYKFDPKTLSPLKDDKGVYVREEVFVNRTVANPLFKDDNGNYAPVMITFPVDTVLELSKYKIGYNGSILSVWWKIIDCPDARYVKRVIEVLPEEMTGAVLELDE